MVYNAHPSAVMQIITCWKTVTWN